MRKIEGEVIPVAAMSEEDVAKFMEWAWQTQHLINLDPGVIKYPRTVMCRATADKEPVAYIPLQPVLMFESLVRPPSLTVRQTAMALWQIGQAVERMAVDAGFREAYFITSDEQEAKTCSRHGWVIAMHDKEQNLWLMKHRVEAGQ